MTNTRLLIEAIEKSGLKKAWIAEQLNITTAALQMKITNSTEFKASEIIKLTKVLLLTKRQRDDIFLS